MILFKAARKENIFRKASLEVDSNLKKIPPSWLKLIKCDQVEVESDLLTRCKLQQTLHAQARGLDVKRSYNTYLPASFFMSSCTETYASYRIIPAFVFFSPTECNEWTNTGVLSSRHERVCVGLQATVEKWYEK